MENELLNVLEPQMLYDTILVSPFCTDAHIQFHDGWFASFAAVGAANELPFLNVRNRNHGLPYNNQDARDQAAYGMEIYSLGVAFFAPQVATQFINVEGTPTAVEEIHSAVWQADLPRHASITLRINQDERLKQQCCLAPCGYGPYGGGEGHGNPAVDAIVTGGQANASVMKGAATMGVPDLMNRWRFPAPLDVPRRATLSAVIKFSEYAREMLRSLTGPHTYGFAGSGRDPLVVVDCCFGIQVSLMVKRYVQQRGQYHV